MSDTNAGKQLIGGDAQIHYLVGLSKPKRGGHIKSHCAPVEAGYPGHA